MTINNVQHTIYLLSAISAECSPSILLQEELTLCTASHRALYSIHHASYRIAHHLSVVRLSLITLAFHGSSSWLEVVIGRYRIVSQYDTIAMQYRQPPTTCLAVASCMYVGCLHATMLSYNK